MKMGFSCLKPCGWPGLGSGCIGAHTGLGELFPVRDGPKVPRARLPGGVATSSCPHVHPEANPAVHLFLSDARPGLAVSRGTGTANTQGRLQ